MPVIKLITQHSRYILIRHNTYVDKIRDVPASNSALKIENLILAELTYQWANGQMWALIKPVLLGSYLCDAPTPLGSGKKSFAQACFIHIRLRHTCELIPCYKSLS